MARRRRAAAHRCWSRRVPVQSVAGGAEIQTFVFNPILARWASQLIGTRRVRLLEDNALTKAPGSGGELKWHQDFPYWPLAQPNAVTAWVALDDTDARNGAMYMAAGSHLTGERLPSVFGTGTPYMRDQRPPWSSPWRTRQRWGSRCGRSPSRPGRCPFTRRSCGTVGTEQDRPSETGPRNPFRGRRDHLAGIAAVRVQLQ